MPPDGVHRSSHYCLPWDLDIWAELNNGRTLTLYDMARIPAARRLGVLAAIRPQGWYMTMAGATVRWRRRIRMFDRLDIASQMVGHDARFFYMTQSMWRGSEATSAIVYRIAIAGPDGIIPPARVLALMGHPDWNPPLPDWIATWSAAEASQPWPPQTDQQDDTGVTQG